MKVLKFGGSVSRERRGFAERCDFCSTAREYELTTIEQKSVFLLIIVSVGGERN